MKPGPVICQISSAPTSLLAGLSIFGELVVSQPTPTPTGPVPRTSTPTSPGPQAAVPTLSLGMLGMLAAALLAAALVLVRR